MKSLDAPWRPETRAILHELGHAKLAQHYSGGRPSIIFRTWTGRWNLAAEVAPPKTCDRNARNFASLAMLVAGPCAELLYREYSGTAGDAADWIEKRLTDAPLIDLVPAAYGDWCTVEGITAALGSEPTELLASIARNHATDLWLASRSTDAAEEVGKIIAADLAACVLWEGTGWRVTPY